MKKLKEILFLSDKGYTDLKKAIGAGWQDKKYNELGVVVRDCNKALNDILVIMLQAEKYVALLAKSLSEYECNDDRVAALQNLGVPYSRY